MEALPSEFDYFTSIPVQAAITEEYEVAISPDASIDGRTNIEFEIAGEPNVYRDLSNSYLAVQCKVTQAENVKLAASTAVSPVNLLLHAMFSSMSIQLCGQNITPNDSNYPYRAFIETLLTYNDDVLRTRGKLAGWVFDGDAAAMDRLTLTTVDNVAPNAAFVERNKPFAESRSVTLVGRPHADLFHQNLDIPPDCSVKITFARSENGFALMAAKDSTYMLTIENARLFVRSKKVSPDLIVAHRAMLAKSNFRFPHTAVAVRKYLAPSDVSEHMITDIFKDRLPKRIIVGLVSHARTGNGYQLNPFKFENFGLSTIGLTVGGRAIPREALQMNYTTGNYSRAYLSMLSALGLDIGNRAISLTPELWASAYNLYAFKVAPGPIDDGPTINSDLRANVNLKLVFSSALTQAVDVIVYSETTSLLEITNLNTVHLS